MSISEFSTALNNHAVRYWFSTERSKVAAGDYSGLNNLIAPTKVYRGKGDTGSAELNSLLVSVDDLATILSVRDKDKVTVPNPKEPTKILRELIKSSPYATKPIKVNGKVTSVLFPNIPFSSIIGLIAKATDTPQKIISDNFHRGHIIGFGPNLLEGVKRDLEYQSTIHEDVDKKAFNTLSKHLDKFVKYLKELDLATVNGATSASNAKNTRIIASANKWGSDSDIKRFLIQMQLRITNLSSGGGQGTVFANIREIFTEGVTKQETLAVIGSITSGTNSENLGTLLANLKSSPSVIDLITQKLLSSLKGTPANTTKYITNNVNISNSKPAKVDVTGIRKEIKKGIAELEQAQLKLSASYKLIANAKLASAAPQIRTSKGQFYSLASLQVLLNTHLQDVISANMGDEPFPGGQRKILNYRTGRFASTVAVERLTMSKAGAITAFYSYMKYPYQTFEPGFKQGSPASRDPRLLVSKSIHEIASTVVGNRLRAVSI